MSYSVSVRISAKHEIAKAEDWYEGRRRGLGLRFRAEVYDSISRISDTPLIFPELLLGNRRLVMHRFPFNIWFRVVGAEVLVMAVIHGKRGSRHIRARLGGA